MGEIHEALRRAKPMPPPERAERVVDLDAPGPPVGGLRELVREELAAPEARPQPATRPTVTLPAERSDGWTQRAVAVDGQGPVAQAFRQVGLRLRRTLHERGIRSLAVVSALRAEGKTTVACNLALAIASLGTPRSVALVDLDLRNPSVASGLSLRAGCGVEEVLAGTRPLEEACVPLEAPALDVYPTHHPQAEAQAVLARPAFEALVRALERRYEIVLYDTPPVLLVPDSPMILERLGGAVAVARAGHTTRRSFQEMCKLIPQSKLLGSLLNEGEAAIPASLYGYYGSKRADDGDASDDV